MIKCLCGAVSDAASDGHINCLRLLMDGMSGADRSGLSGALYGAASNGHTDCLRFLIDGMRGVECTKQARLFSELMIDHENLARVLVPRRDIFWKRGYIINLFMIMIIMHMRI